jgi:hypothetical protein
LIDISVPEITEGRTAEDCERWSVCRLLSTLAAVSELQYPLELVKKERPDFYLIVGKRRVGIEITEAIQPDYARARVLPEAQSRGSIIDPSLFKWGAPRKSVDELRSIVSETELKGPGWEGNEVEVEWAAAVIEVIERKTEKLRSKGFRKFDENWLAVYDNLNSFALEMSEVSCMLIESMRAYWSGDSFDRVFIETGGEIMEIKSGGYTCFAINDLWRDHRTTA